MTRKTAFLAAALAALAGPVLAQEPWEGIWTADPSWCAFAELIGSHDPAPVFFSATEIRGLENTCKVAGVQADYQFSYYIVTSECAAEGELYPQVDVLMLGEDEDAGGGEVLWRWAGYGEPVRLTRCGEN